MSALSVSVHGSISELQKEAWNALLTDSDNPFVRHEFLAALEQSGCVCPETSWTPCHFAIRRGNTLCAVVPAYIKDGSDGDFSRDWEWAGAAQRAGIPYYPKLVLGIPFTPVCGRRILHPEGLPPHEISDLFSCVIETAKQIMKRFSLGAIQVLFPPADQQELFVAHGLIPRIDFQYHFFNPGYRDRDEFDARFSSKRRNILKRERSAPESQGIQIRTLRAERLLRDPVHYAKLAHALHRSTVDKLVWGRRWLNEAFYVQLFSTLLAPLELVIAQSQGDIIAGAFNVASQRRLFGRYWGCFRELPFLHFNVCLYHSIDECIARKTQVFEGGAGGEHKIARGFEPTETHSAHAFADPSFHAALARHVKTESENRRQAIAAWRKNDAVLKPLVPSIP